MNISDTRFKWIVSSITICVVAIAGMYFGASTNRAKKPSSSKGRIEYIYVDNIHIAHLNRKCKRLNYKYQKAERIKVEDLSKYNIRIDNYCTFCVDDSGYEYLRELNK